MSTCKIVTSKDNPLLQKLRKIVTDPFAYRKLGCVWVEGDHLCQAVLTHQVPVPLAVIADSDWTGSGGLITDQSGNAEKLSALASHADQVVVVPRKMWGEFSTTPAPVCVGFVLPAPIKVLPILEGVPSLVLDRLQDAGNLGTILRTAYSLGIKQVVALKGTAGLWSPKVLRAGMGAHWGLHLVEGVCMNDLHLLKVPLLAASPQGQYDLQEAPLPPICAWVMGHEGQGIDNALLKQCGLTVRIPQPGGGDSLNVASAAAICMYESIRRGGTKS